MLFSVPFCIFVLPLKYFVLPFQERMLIFMSDKAQTVKWKTQPIKKIKITHCLAIRGTIYVTHFKLLSK